MARIQRQFSPVDAYPLNRRGINRSGKFHRLTRHKASQASKPASALPNHIDGAIHIPTALSSFFLRNLNRLRHVGVVTAGLGGLGMAATCSASALALYLGGIQTYFNTLYHSTTLFTLCAACFLIGSAIRRTGFPGKYVQKIWLPRLRSAKRKLTLLLPQLKAHGEISKPLYDQILNTLSISEENQIHEYFPDSPSSLEIYALNILGQLEIAHLHLRLLTRFDALKDTQMEKAQRVIRGVLAAHLRNTNSGHLTSIEQFEKIRKAYESGLSRLNGVSIQPALESREPGNSKLWQKSETFVRNHQKAFRIMGTTLLATGMALYFDLIRFRTIVDLVEQSVHPGVMDKLRFTLLFSPLMGTMSGLTLLILPFAFGLKRRRFLQKSDDPTTPPHLAQHVTQKFKKFLYSFTRLEEPLRKIGVTLSLPSLAAGATIFAFNRLFIPQIMSEMTLQYFTPALLVWMASLGMNLGGVGFMILGASLRQLKESSWIKRGDFAKDFKPRILETSQQLQTHLHELAKIAEEKDLFRFAEKSVLSEQKLEELKGSPKILNQAGKTLFQALESAEVRQLEILDKAQERKG